jgi:hypothetical protein
MTLIDHIPTPQEIAARRARMGYQVGYKTPVVAIPRIEPKPEPVAQDKTPTPSMADKLTYSTDGQRRRGVKLVRQSIMTLELVNTVSPDMPTKARIRAMLRAVAEGTGVTVEDMCGPSRFGAITIARQYAMWKIYTVGKVGLSDIGRAMNKDHTTVLSAVRKISKLMAAQGMPIREVAT